MIDFKAAAQEINMRLASIKHDPIPDNLSGLETAKIIQARIDERVDIIRERLEEVYRAGERDGSNDMKRLFSNALGGKGPTP